MSVFLSPCLVVDQLQVHLVYNRHYMNGVSQYSKFKIHGSFDRTLGRYICR